MSYNSNYSFGPSRPDLNHSHLSSQLPIMIQQQQQQQQQQQLPQHPQQTLVEPVTIHPTQSGPTRRGPWSPEEDRKLMELISIFGPSNWVRISNSLCTRTPKQCRERYHQNLKPSLNRTPITQEEGLLIEKLVAKHGKKWAEIARHLNGRSDNAIKNWWNGGANRRRRQSSNVPIKLIDDTGDHQLESNTGITSIKKSTPTPTQYPQVHNLPQISFNTSMFGSSSNNSNNGDKFTSITPPPNNKIIGIRSASFDINNQNSILPPLTSSTSSNILPTKRRLLDEHNPLLRRHSTTNTTNFNHQQPINSPYQDLTRNNSIEFFGSNNNSSSTSRRSSIAPDFFPNPLKESNHKRNISQHSFNSPSLTPQQRFSVSSASGLNPLSNNTSPNQILKPIHSNSESSIYSNHGGSISTQGTNISVKREVDSSIEEDEEDKTKISVKSLID